jgi:hypothetical protein
MDAVAKSPLLQLMPVAGQHVAKALLDNPLTPLRVTDLNEARQLSQFVTVVVLLPASSVDDGTVSPQITKNRSPGGTAGPSKLVQLFATRSEDDLVFGDVKVSFSSMEATRKGKSVTLRALEFKTLKYLAQNARRVISRDELLNEVWGYENYPCTRTVDNHILKLRQKLERDPSRPVHFQTVHRAGYKFLP